LDFCGERYVRIYTRDTPTWRRWGWEGQVVFMITDGVLVCPKWVDGQTAVKSASARCRDYRMRLKEVRAVATDAKPANDTNSVASDTKSVGSDTPRDAATRSDTERAPSRAEQSKADLFPTRSDRAEDLTGSARVGAVYDISSSTIPVQHRSLPRGWKPSERTIAVAQELGFTPDQFREVLDYCRNRVWDRAFIDPDRQVQQVLVRWKRNAESREHASLERRGGVRGLV
jgi:hypothetical protein